MDNSGTKQKQITLQPTGYQIIISPKDPRFDLGL